MRILSVDTATRSCSVAITHQGSVLAEVTIDTEETHTKHLMGVVDTVLDLSRSTITDLDGFAVTRGPGSFTGLRIGIASIKGLASVAEKPLVGVSTLAALAMQAVAPRLLICALLDARRGEVYAGRFRLEEAGLKPLVEERVCSATEAIAGIQEACLFVGNGATLYREVILETLGSAADFAPALQNTIRASTVAHLSSAQFSAGRTDDLARFVPVYLRRSDAEIHLSARKSGK